MNKNHFYHKSNSRSFLFLSSLSSLSFHSTSKSTQSTQNRNISRHRKQKGHNGSNTFLDKIQIQVQGGAGGQGCISYESRGKSSYKRRPNGGHGGNGGSVVLLASDQVKSCLRPIISRNQGYIKSGKMFVAGNGANGGNQCRHGRNGNDLVVHVPCGVIVRENIMEEEDEDWETYPVDSFDIGHMPVDDDEATLNTMKEETDDNDDDDDDYDEIVNSGIRAKDGMYHWRPSSEIGDNFDDSENTANTIKATRILADLDEPNSYIIAARGGRGGTGNSLFASRKYHFSHTQTAAEKMIPNPPTFASLELELKLIADMGLVGYPNAGKSTLLHALSRASPKIAPYPFTTLHPLVGCVEYRDGLQIKMADVPGLIEGAASGRGRGMDFLRHLERTKALLYIVDGSTTSVIQEEGRNAVKDLKVLAKELTLYDLERKSEYNDNDNNDSAINFDNLMTAGMMARPALVVVNKLDLVSSEDERQEILFNVGLAVEEAGIQINGDVMGISAGVTGEGLQQLSKAIRETVQLAQAN